MLSGEFAPCANTGVTATAAMPKASAAVPIVRVIFSLDIIVRGIVLSNWRSNGCRLVFLGL
jgi:hypothetical protein